MPHDFARGRLARPYSRAARWLTGIVAFVLLASLAALALAGLFIP